MPENPPRNFREALQALNTAQKFDPENAGIAINRAALLTSLFEPRERIGARG